MTGKEFTPKFFTLLQSGISKERFFKDLVAGIIVGIVALPLAIAFAIASGVSPDKGLITAVIAGFLISVLGGSRVQIGGPTGAFIVIVYAIVQKFGLAGLTTATFMAGFIIIAMGLARLGNWLKYVPYPLIVGFTSGIALIIFSSQINDFLGLGINNLPADFIEKWGVYFEHINSVNIYALVIAVLTVIISFGFGKVSKKIPGSIIAILLSTLVVQLFNIPVDTIETKFGEISGSFSLPELPVLKWETIKELIQPAFAIALLGGMESLLSAVVADGMIGGKHRSNMELVAQGTANIFSALFGGIPATGAIARTATNVKNGGRTPIAGITHALVLLLIMLIFAPYAKLIPLATLAGILVVVSYHMGEWHRFFSLIKSEKNDVIILLTTFFLTVIFDLVIAIEVGIVLSSFMFMKRMSDSLEVKTAFNLENESGTNGEKLFDDELNRLPEEVLLYEINGPLFFGAAQQFQDTVKDLNVLPKIIILRMRYVPFIDATGVQRLIDTLKFFTESKVEVIFSGVNSKVKNELEKAKIYTLLRPENLTDSIGNALTRAEQILGELK